MNRFKKLCLIGVVLFLFINKPTTTFGAEKTILQGKNIQMTSPFLIPANENKNDIQNLFSQRPITHITPFNIIETGIQTTVSAGVPVDSLLLILFIPIMATIVVFLRYIVGFPTLGIAPTIVFAITFFITGIVFGSILFITLLVSTLLSRILFKRIRIMQLTKVSLSMLVVSILIIITLLLSLHYHLINSGQISIFPILLFILLSERVVALQLEKNLIRAIGITLLTLMLGIAGFFTLSTQFMRNLLLVYPETLILLIPINWFIGRYFGLRFTEYFRFLPNIRYANK